MNIHALHNNHYYYKWHLLFSTAYCYGCFVRSLKLIDFTSPWKYFNIFFIFEGKDERLAQPIEFIGHVPVLTLVRSKYGIVDILNEEHCIVSIVSIVIERLHANPIPIDREKKMPFSHSYKGW